MDNLEEVYKKFFLDFSDVFYDTIKNNDFSNYVFLCIGSDRITGDSFRPICGT